VPGAHGEQVELTLAPAGTEMEVNKGPTMIFKITDIEVRESMILYSLYQLIVMKSAPQPDNTWRDTQTWAEFLNYPTSSVVAYTQDRKSGDSGFETCLGVIPQAVLS
jgi:hypothetical protein